MERLLSYSEVYALLAQYATDMLPEFADGWSRFPVGAAARLVENRLESESQFWSKREGNEALGASLAAAAYSVNEQKDY